MGVIKRQGIKQSLVNYFAVLIGAISTLYIYPQDLELVGLIRFLMDMALFLSPFLMLGFSGVTIRFFPYFENEEKQHNGFLFLLLSGVLLGSSLFVLLIWLFWDNFASLYAEQPEIYQSFLIYIVPISILLAFLQLFYSYSANFKRIVVPSIFQNLIKITQPLVVLLFIWQMISLSQVINAILFNFVFALVGMVVYIYFLGQLKLRPNFKLLDRPMQGEIRRFALFGLFMGVGNMLALRIDSVMIATFIDFKNNGIYTIAAFIGNAIAIPTNALSSIASPIVSQAFKDNNMAEISELYRRASINLLVVGLFIFVGVAVSIHDLFAIMPKNEELLGGAMIVIILGFAKIVDMATSINNQIINYSPHYRFGFYAILMMAVFNVVCNYIFIQWLGLIGVALATLVSLSLYNLVKFLFIWARFKMQPFSMQSLYILGIAGMVYGIGYLLPSLDSAYLNIIFHSIVVAVLYLGAILYFNIAPDLTQLIRQILTRIGIKIN